MHSTGRILSLHSVCALFLLQLPRSNTWAELVKATLSGIDYLQRLRGTCGSQISDANVAVQGCHHEETDQPPGEENDEQDAEAEALEPAATEDAE